MILKLLSLLILQLFPVFAKSNSASLPFLTASARANYGSVCKNDGDCHKDLKCFIANEEAEGFEIVHKEKFQMKSNNLQDMRYGMLRLEGLSIYR